MLMLDSLPLSVRLLLGLLVVMMGLPLLLGPLLLKSQHTIQRSFRIVAQAADSVPVEARDLTEKSFELFAEAGFEWLGYYQLNNYAVGIQSWFGLWRHAQKPGLAAMTGAIYQLPSGAEAGREARFAMGYTELSGLFSDGFCLCVNNSTQFAAFDSDHKLILRYPEYDLPELLARYDQVSGCHPRCREPQTVRSGDEMNQMRQLMLQELEQQVKAGLYTLDHTQQCYRLTWTGAIVMTMRHLKPFTWLRHARDKQLAARWARAKA